MHITCCVVGNAHLLSSNLWSSQQSKNRQQFCTIFHLRNKACTDILSCAQNRTSGSSPVFPTLMLVQAILLQAAARHNIYTVATFKYNSAFHIFIHKPKAPCFIISSGNFHIFLQYTAVIKTEKL